MPKEQKEEMTAPLVIESMSKYDEPDVVEYVVRNRNSKKSFSDIAEGLKERGLNASPQVAEQIFTKALARAVVTHTAAKEVFDDYTDILKNMYGESIEIMGIYVKKLRAVIDQITGLDETSLENKMMIIKTIPTAVTLMKEIRECVNTQIDIQDKITKTGEKELLMSSADVLEQVNKYLPQLEQMGYIKIINPVLKGGR